MPSYVKSHSLEIGPITDLIGRCVACIGLGNAYTPPLGYVMCWVQVGVQGYNEDQIALVVLDLSNFAVWVPIILGTSTVSCIINIMKERGNRCLGDNLGQCPGGPLLVQRASTIVEDDQVTGESGQGGYNKVVVTKNTETIDAFSFLCHTHEDREGLPWGKN